ncbi:MAG: UDP-2,3-diacylglucosamine diphosphatase [Alphaproteobacteria bacterium]|nr:UDP-2,3-diacylglucosamine diphosphatase [Alphaproteobacteria bacterium]
MLEDLRARPKPDSASGKIDDPGTVLRYRAIWISDFHLGTRGCQADRILDFLKHTESEFLYLVGDIVDAWQLKKRWYWPQTHNDVIQKIMRRAHRGSQVYFIPGNHDEAARSFCGLSFGGVQVVNEIVHTTASDQRLLILHGDQFDAFLHHAKWLAKLGDTAYTFLLKVNGVLNYIRRKLGFSYWSLSAYLKHKVKNAMEHISAFETLVADEARRNNVDGVVCGHIHQIDMRKIGDVLYCNDGDWVESCSALVEDFQGHLSLINWPNDREQLLQQAGITISTPVPA